jgi:hypothetical protein
MQGQLGGGAGIDVAFAGARERRQCMETAPGGAGRRVPREPVSVADDLERAAWVLSKP